jgi:hypothetical protein
VSRFFISPTASGSRTKFYWSVALFVLALLVALEISQFVLTDDWKSLGFMVIGIAGLAFAVRILNNWRHGLYIFFGSDLGLVECPDAGTCSRSRLNSGCMPRTQFRPLNQYEGFAKTMNRETIAKHKHVCRLRLTCASP